MCVARGDEVSWTLFIGPSAAPCAVRKEAVNRNRQPKGGTYKTSRGCFQPVNDHAERRALIGSIGTTVGRPQGSKNSGPAIIFSV